MSVVNHDRHIYVIPIVSNVVAAADIVLPFGND